MNWDRLIQPLGQGSYDVAGLLRSLRELGYDGPIGFQGYGIPGDSRELLEHTMNVWEQWTAPGGREFLGILDPAEERNRCPSDIIDFKVTRGIWVAVVILRN